MPSLLREFLDSSKTRRLTDPRNLVLYFFVVIVIAITWSGVKAIQTNYELQRKIAVLQQQNQVLDLQNKNIDLQNQFYGTEQYLELAARQQLGLAAPGEKVLLLPESIALKYFDSSLSLTTNPNLSNSNAKTGMSKNLEAWRDFLFGHKLTTE